MELSREETEDNLLRLCYDSKGWQVHEARVLELIAAEDAAIAELTLRPLKAEELSKLNFHIAKREGLQVSLYLKDDVKLDADPAVESV